VCLPLLTNLRGVRFNSSLRPPKKLKKPIPPWRMTQYGKADYWNDRYSKDPDSFDWYQRYDTLKPFIKKHTKPSDKILMVGAGSSQLSEDMYKDGFKEITNIDISSVIVNLMQQKYSADFPGLTYKVLDVTNMSEIPSASFDVAIDKGTMDAILCGDGSVSNTDKMLTEILRILRPGGTFMLITYGEPASRLHYLEKPRYGWKVETQTVDKPKVPGATTEGDVHYIYTLKKN